MSKVGLLVVENHGDLRDLIAQRFRNGGYDVVEAATASAGLAALRTAQPDVIIIDLRLPDIGELSVYEEFRRLTHVPIVLLTVEISPAVQALDMGAADYVRKPVDLTELIARVQAALRARGPRQPSAAIDVGALRIDEQQGIAQYNGRDIGASITEARLLGFMARRPETVFSKDQLLTAVWRAERTTHLVEVHIANIRGKLRSAGCQKELIKTVRALGYKFCGSDS